MALLWKTPHEILLQIAARLKKRRLFKNLSQRGLALKAGISLGTLKRFERTGEIALSKMLVVALVLDCLDECDRLFEEMPLTPREVLGDGRREKKARKRGMIT